MTRQGDRRSVVYLVSLFLVLSTPAAAQTVERNAAPTRGDILRGAYGEYRANNDLLSYHLDIRVDPARQFIGGKNTIRFRMLQGASRIQIDLYAYLAVDRILLGSRSLTYEREVNAVFVDFPEPLVAGREYAIDFYYSGTPEPTARFGGISFRKDPAGRDWVTTACEDVGASYWWPNKDQWRDEVERMDISVAVPNGLMDVSNGSFQGRTDLGDGFSRWDWHVDYPINSYAVALNIAAYEHFADRLGSLPLDFYALPEDVERAKTQFAQARPILETFQRAVGEYPFIRDGYKLIQVPYAGMEHQSAVAYGNRFANGYFVSPDWTGVGISPRFDFIIVHESAHEWFGNSVTAADVSDMWIHEGWATYLECVFVEQRYGHPDYLRYVNALKSKVRNVDPVVTRRGIHEEPSQDMYFKGALFIHTVRSVVDDDARWRMLLREFYSRFQYRTILTEDIVAFFSEQTGQDLTAIFNAYLRHSAVPTLELRFDETARTVSYRWRSGEQDFAMPVRVGRPDAWQIIRPTTAWNTMPWTMPRTDFEVATDLYYVYVERQ